MALLDLSLYQLLISQPRFQLQNVTPNRENKDSTETM